MSTYKNDSNEAMKVLLVITSLSMGGAENVVAGLADTLAERGHLVKIVYLTGNKFVVPENSNIEIICIGLDSFRDMLKSYISLRKIVKKMKPDVVHSHMFHANIITRLLKLTTRIPRIISSSHSNNEGGRARMLAYLLTDKLVTISTNVSQEAVNDLVNKGAIKAGRMIPVANGIDTNRFYFNSSARKKKRAELDLLDKKIVLAVGRLHEAKDYKNLLNAIFILKKQRQDFKLLIIGDGLLRQELTLLTKKLEITDFVEFLGMRRDVPELMSASDVFVLSSAWEGFGLVLAEAMACERVVVATDCGGVSEVVGSEGFLIDPKNSASLAQALNEALSLSDDERSRIGVSARKRIVEHYSLEANVNAYLKLYR